MLKKVFLICLLLPAISFAASFVEGKDYQVVTSTDSSGNSKVPNVVEFFSYGCPWCYKMEKPFADWSKTLDKNVQVDQVPVVFKPSWDLYAKAFYTAKTLALSNKLTPALFKAIQEDKKNLDTKPAMIHFFIAHGVDREIAKSAFESSPSIDMKVSNGMSLMASYQVNAVPAFVINNKYKTDLQMAGSQERLFQIMDYLLKH